MDALTEKQVERLSGINRHTKAMNFGAKIKTIIEVINAGVGPQGPAGEPGAIGAQGPQGEPGPCTKIPNGTPVNAISAKETLTISGVVAAGESVLIDNPEITGADNYVFASDVALNVGEGFIPVDINAVTVKASNALTVDINPTVGDKMTIGDKVFTFVPNGTANGDGEIDVEDLLADTQVNIIAAIRGTDHNTPHPLVTCEAAFLNNVLQVSALSGGSAGNNIDTTETFTAETNVFSAAKLANGADCAAADAVTALVNAITDNDTQGVGAADGIGNTVVLTADVGGVIGNDIIIGTTLVYGTFTDGAVKLSGGVDGTVGSEGEPLIDSQYLYICAADNTINGKNWHRISLGSPF